jgi:hypothetical protein
MMMTKKTIAAEYFVNTVFDSSSGTTPILSPISVNLMYTFRLNMIYLSTMKTGGLRLN